MNMSTENFDDFDLPKQIEDALVPPPMSRSEIESIESRDFESDPQQLDRIMARTRVLLADSGGVERSSFQVRTNPSKVEVTMQRMERPASHRKRNPRGAVAALAVSAMALVAALFWTSQESYRQQTLSVNAKQESARRLGEIRAAWMTPETPSSGSLSSVKVGDVIETSARERRRLSLPDGSVLYVNERSSVHVATSRRVLVDRGEVFVEVVPQFDDELRKEPFEIVTPSRTVTALGTRFGVRAKNEQSDIVVTQGRVKVSGVDAVLESGQQVALRSANPQDDAEPYILAANRASEELSWTRDLMNASMGEWVPNSDHAGGSIVTIDPDGQEMKLSLRKFHVDVHIEDGFARTTIDQTYFNHTQSRLEGTFHFPLPPDASLSRLAMYVNGKLMEGGMAERQHARNTFEQIVHKMKDPALLEWVDGTTFKMRVFPLEARQEKRIVLSYSQRLETAYGRSTYRFPAGHSMDRVGKWSTSIRVNRNEGLEWNSPTHHLDVSDDQGDLILSTSKTNSAMDRDLVLELKSQKKDAVQQNRVVWTSAEHNQQKYLMLRFRPDLPGRLKRTRRNWVFLFESAADRNPLLAGTQLEVVRTLLTNAEHDDTFSILTANTKSEWLNDSAQRCSVENVTDAAQKLESTHLVGALDLEQALRTVGERVVTETKTQDRPECENVIVHLGSAIPVLGEQDHGELLRVLPEDVSYVGVGVGKLWSRPFMKAAASRTGGYFTQINPDNEVAWRAFELSSLLNTPRLLNVRVGLSGQRDRKENGWLTYADTVVQGEEICALTKLSAGAALPDNVMVTGELNGRPWKQLIRTRDVRAGADYLPRSWARLEIDRLLADNGTEHRSEIIRLSKSMYVMSPYTSLLVLENEQMYSQYNIDRGRDDHWALYPCPSQIEVVHEPLIGPLNVAGAADGESLSGSVRWLAPLAPGSNYLTMRNRYDRWGKQIRPQIQLSDGAVSGSVLIPQFEGQIYYGTQGVSTIDGQSLNGMTDLSILGLYRQAAEGSPDVGLRILNLKSPMLPADESVLFASPPVDYGGDEFGVMRYRLHSLQTLDLGEQRGESFGVYTGPFYPWPAPAAVPVYQAPASDNLQLVLPFDTSGRNSGLLPLDEVRFQRLQYGGQFPSWYETDLGWSERRLEWDDGNWQLSFDQRRLPNSGVQRVLQEAGLWFDPESRLMAIESERLDFDFDEAVPREMLSLPGTRLKQQLRELTKDEMSLRFVREKVASDYIRLPEIRELELQGRPGLFQKQRNANQFYLSSVDPVKSGSVLWRDLFAYAPALNTWHSDTAGVIDDGEKLPAVRRGRVENGARHLIDRARGQGWHRVQLLSGDDEILNLQCDGLGQHSYRGSTALGLKWKVQCDGKTLRHFYPELGLAAKRTFNRHHFRRLQSMVPWLVRSADDWSRNADVRLISKNTVAVSLLSDAGEDDGEAPGRTERAKQLEIHLVFAENGSLSERRVVDAETGTIRWAVRFGADGTIVIQNGDQLETLPVTFVRESIDPPAFDEMSEEFVELPMPVRSVQFLDTAADGEQKVSQSERNIARVLALLAENRGVEARDLLRTRFLEKGDRRDGLFVLLSRVPGAMNWTEDVPGAEGRKREVDLRPSPDRSTLKQFVRQHMNMWSSGPAVFDLDGPDDSFVSRMATAHNIFVLWSTGRATESRTETQIEDDLKHALAFIATLPADSRAWSLLETIQSRLSEAGHQAILAESLKSFGGNALLSRLAQQERARLLFKAGRTGKARKVYRRWLVSAVEQGMLPQIDEELRTFYVAEGGVESWNSAVRKCSQHLIQRKDLLAAFRFSARLRTLGDVEVAGELLENVVSRLEVVDSPGVAVLAIEQLKRLKDDRAEELVDRVLQVERLRNDPRLWRFASEVADELGHRQKALLRMEYAVHLEFRNGPDIVDVKQLRQTYDELMKRFGEVIDAAATLETDVPDDLYARLIRAADQWRSLDSDTTTCCHTTARLLAKLKRPEEAWQYLTTPLAGRSGESTPWRTLAKSLAEQEDVELADMAYVRAFEFEQTNPEILLEHAVFLKSQGRNTESTRLLKKIADTGWQPRFKAVQQQARGLLP